jgi:hypothetical protein
MTGRRLCLLVVLCLGVVISAPPPSAGADDEECTLNPSACFGLESLDAALSTSQAGAHPDLTVNFTINQNPNGILNPSGLHDSYEPTRNVRIELPPGLVGDPNVLGPPQQCTVKQLVEFENEGCPNGSQIGISRIYTALPAIFAEPVYMMIPPGGDVIARLGFVAGTLPTFIDVRLRSESDYGLVSEIVDSPAAARLIRAETTLWGVPAAPVHDTERCTQSEVFQKSCVASPSRPPGSRPLPFLTNPTRCHVPLQMRVSASSWAEPDRYDTKTTSFPEISGCDALPFKPKLSIQPTSPRAAGSTGLDLSIRLPAAEGGEALEPSQVREMRLRFPPGLSVNASSADGLGSCSAAQVRFGERVAAECPDSAKIADVELDIPALPRRMKGSVYLRDPEPGNLFRLWVVADDLGAHVKQPAQLVIDGKTGQIESVVLGTPETEGIPQAPLREIKLSLKSGERAPLVNPPACGTYGMQYQLVPWSGGPPASGVAPMVVDQGCESVGGFSPNFAAGTLRPAAGQYSPAVFALSRKDGEQEPARLQINLPGGLLAKLAGIPRCEGAAAATGACPPASRIGRIIASTGAGALPLWVPIPGRRPTGVYLGGPYQGAPFSAIAVVPAQAGPFDLGDIVVRNAIEVDPVRAQGVVRSDPLPQIIEGIPILYRDLKVILDRPDFVLNPTGCAQKSIDARLTSTQGSVAEPSSPFQAANCARLPFAPRLSFTLDGGTTRGAHPALRAALKPRAGNANIAGASVALPHSEFLDQAHIGTVCTRVQFAARTCPAASIYGHAVARSPLLDQPLSGPVYLRSSNNPLPDLVARLGGELEVQLVGRIDSINGGIRSTFDFVPDAPVTSFVLKMAGGQKGLLVNSTNLCADTHRATAKFNAQNGRRVTLRPPMQVKCGGGKR